MEEEKLDYPYYETTYRDDDRVLHFANIREQDIDFYKERFDVISIEYKVK